MFTMVKLMSFDVAYHQLALLMQKKRAYQEVFSLLDTLFLCSANPYPFSVITPLPTGEGPAFLFLPSYFTLPTLIKYSAICTAFKAAPLRI